MTTSDVAVAMDAALPEGAGRDLMAANLADEQGDPVAHVDLFEGFAHAVEAAPDPASPATLGLLATYAELLADSPMAALAGFVAYEWQASAVARLKAEGLRVHYGLDDQAVSFWEHHARVDVEHGAWAIGALTTLGEAPNRLLPSIRLAADAWWGFLDEREAAAPAG
jgi:pyrroloquinoline quinone (PQQ) biosynthesis protein C